MAATPKFAADFQGCMSGEHNLQELGLRVEVPASSSARTQATEPVLWLAEFRNARVVKKFSPYNCLGE
jgi:hypothetical protein